MNVDCGWLIPDGSADDDWPNESEEDEEAEEDGGLFEFWLVHDDDEKTRF